MRGVLEEVPYQTVDVTTLPREDLTLPSPLRFFIVNRTVQVIIQFYNRRLPAAFVFRGLTADPEIFIHY